MSTNWANSIPTVSFGDTGNTLGFYYKVAYYLVSVPVALLFIVAIVYNVLVGVATAWMYKHAWRKGGFVTVNQPAVQSLEESSKNIPIVPGLPTTIWEDIFTINIKISNFLFGNRIDVKDHNGYLVMCVHDYIVHMPCAMVFLQLCQFAVAIILVVLYADYLVLQVTHSCDSTHATKVDCYSADDFNMSSLPLDCEDLPGNITKYTCFHLSLNPVIASAVVGGFLKITPNVLFNLITFSYLKMTHFTNYFSFSSTFLLASKMTVALIAEFLFLGGGVVVLACILKIPSLRDLTFAQANPMRQMTFIFCFALYFLASSFVWCIFPQTKTAVRFQTSVWKQKVVSARGTDRGQLKPWIVVDRSMETTDQKLLSDDD